MSRTLLWPLAAMVACAGCANATRETAPPEEGTPEWHAAQLIAGDVRGSIEKLETRETMTEEEEAKDWFHASRGEPYHLRRLIAAKVWAVPVLLQMLENDKPVPIQFDYSVTWMSPLGFGGGMLLGECKTRQATVADLADYALRQIYGTDVGFRSYRSEEARRHSILHWQEVVRKRRRDPDLGRNWPVVAP